MTAERFYSGLLMAYSEAFRREYGDQLIETFRDLHRDWSGSVMTFWVFIVGDVIRSAARQRLAALRKSIERPDVQWVLMSAGGGMGIAAMAHALTWCFSYLYHPYLEGIFIPAWVCGASLGLALGVVQSAKVDHQLPSRIVLIVTTSVAAALGLQITVILGKPALYGTALGVFVSGAQWLVLRSRHSAVGSWMLSSMTAMWLAVAASAGAISVTLRGLEPRASEAYVMDLRDVAPFFPVAMWHSMSSISVMIVCGFLSAVLTARLLSTTHSKGRSC